MLWEMFNAAKDLGRIHEIASILIRYGFGGFVQELGFRRFLEKAGKVLHWKSDQEHQVLDTPQRMRCALEELGPTFVKLGQILATRSDLFSPAYIAEFEKLQDAAPPIPFEELREQLEEDLGASVEEVFLSFDKKAFAAASIAQVHRARLKNGVEVIVKIRRPNLRRIIEADLRLLQRIVDIIEVDAPELRRYHPKEVVRQFTRSLRQELDLATEARNSERIAENFVDDEYIVIPEIYWEWTCERLNVQEYIPGIQARNLAAMDAAGLDKKVLAERGANAVMKMIIEDGFFHADPHAGNILFLPDNKLVFIDFGMVGRLTLDRRDQVVGLLFGMINNAPSKVVEILEDWSDNINTDEQTLTLEIEMFVDQYSSLSIKELNLTRMMVDLMSLLRDHKLILPADLALLIKTYITLDGLGRYLDPDGNTLLYIAPYIQKIMVARYKPEAVAKRGWRNLVSVVDLLNSLPKELHKLLRASRKGAIQVEVNVRHLNQLVEKTDRAMNRLAMALVTSALIIATSIVMSVKGGPEIMGLPAFGFLGYLFSTIAGFGLLISIWRSGHGK
ncbi:MAG: ubiquinone biosynthesis protein UbiB [Methylococcaceae bacterium]|nr:ubiquinone biosynthesis protein UbiB [Methylococcaceae bacterium]